MSADDSLGLTDILYGGDTHTHSVKNGYGSPASTNLCTKLEYFNTSASLLRQCGE